MTLELRPGARALALRLGVERDATCTADRQALARVLRRTKHPLHASVFRFERSFGGLLIRGHERSDWREAKAFAVVGAYHTLRRGWSWRRTAGLVPVVCGTHDDVGYLDAKGRGWSEDTIEGPGPELVATNGAGLVTFLIAWELLYRDVGGRTLRKEPTHLPLVSSGPVRIRASATAIAMTWVKRGVTTIRKLE